jgi:nucleotide-binding universal stress UspA family protein
MTEFKRILVPYDFSPHSAQALRTAARLLAPGGRLILLNVVGQVLPVSDVATPGMITFITGRELVEKGRRELARVIAKAVPAELRKRVESKVVIGDPRLRIVAEARKADLVVMSTVGRTGLAHLLIGSVAETVVRHSPVPVLTVRPPRAVRGARRSSPRSSPAARRRGVRAGRAARSALRSPRRRSRNR